MAKTYQGREWHLPVENHDSTASPRAAQCYHVDDPLHGTALSFGCLSCGALPWYRTRILESENCINLWWKGKLMKIDENCFQDNLKPFNRFPWIILKLPRLLWVLLEDGTFLELKTPLCFKAINLLCGKLWYQFNSLHVHPTEPDVAALTLPPMHGGRNSKSIEFYRIFLWFSGCWRLCKSTLFSWAGNQPTCQTRHHPWWRLHVGDEGFRYCRYVSLSKVESWSHLQKWVKFGPFFKVAAFSVALFVWDCEIPKPNFLVAHSFLGLISETWSCPMKSAESWKGEWHVAVARFRFTRSQKWWWTTRFF